MLVRLVINKRLCYGYSVLPTKTIFVPRKYNITVREKFYGIIINRCFETMRQKQNKKIPMQQCMVSIYPFLYVKYPTAQVTWKQEIIKIQFVCHLHEKITNDLDIEKGYFIFTPSGETIILTIHHDIFLPSLQHTVLVYYGADPLEWWQFMGNRLLGGALEVQ